MWYVLAAEPDACVYCGLKPGVTRAQFEATAPAGTLEALLVRVPVKADDAIYVPGGRVHAIGAGCVLLECQQNSNTTYRLYDWGRVGADGRPRALHIEQALQVIRWTDHASPLVQPRLLEKSGDHEQWEVLTSPFFRMERHRLLAPRSWPAQPASRSACYSCSRGRFRSRAPASPKRRTRAKPISCRPHARS
jgi:mannose-6-phosphate isomerase